MYNFPLGYFKDEYREGFLVESMVKRAWAAQMEVLGHIIRICEKYDIKYWAMWGTLLGAIRHSGYIPWDDDLDIAMKRVDYDRFLQVAKNELPDGYVVMSPYTEPEWKEQITRVNNSHSIKFTDDFLDEYHGFPYSTGIDIFPYDYVPDSESQCREQANLIDLVVKTREHVIEKNNRVETGEYNGELDEVISFGLKNLETLFGFEFNKEVYLDNQLLCLYDQLSASYGDESCTYMTCLAERAKRQEKNSDFLVPAFLFDETIDHDFEGFSIKVPKYYEIVVSMCYGKNFMTPIKSGVAGHDYPFYKRQVNILKELGRYEEVMEAVNNSDKRAVTKNISTFIDNIKVGGSFSKSNLDFNKGSKKAIMYCMSTIDVFGQEDAAIDKLCRTITFFEEKKNEVQLVLLLDTLVEEILERVSEHLLTRYREVVDKYIKDNWGSYIYKEKVLAGAEYCDAYYGSANEFIKLFTSNNKPVMIQNIDV